MTGRDLLHKYLRETGQRPSDVARETGIDDGLLSKLLSGKRTAGLRTALLLQSAAGIPLEAWAKKGKRRAG